MEGLGPVHLQLLVEGEEPELEEVLDDNGDLSEEGQTGERVSPAAEGVCPVWARPSTGSAQYGVCPVRGRPSPRPGPVAVLTSV